MRRPRLNGRAAGLLIVVALAIAAAAIARPLRRVPAGSWRAERDGIRVGGWYPAWRGGEIRSNRQPLSFDSRSVRSRDGIEFSLRVSGKLAPGRDLRLPAADDFTRAFTARFVDPLVSGWETRDGVAILERGADAERESLLRALADSGVTAEELRVQIVAPASFAERFGRDKVRRLSRPPAARVLMVGYDAADWEIIRPLLAQGRLPNLRRLLDGAAYGRMRPFSPMMSPLLWTTMVTGKTPAEHNINDFVVELPDGKIKPIGSNFRTVKALWEIAPLAGRNTAFIDWWASYPAEESERGVILSNAVRNLARLKQLPPRTGATYPEDYMVKYFPRLHANYSVSAADMRPLVTLTDEELEEAADKQAAKKPKEGRKVVQEESVLVLRDAVGMTRGNTGEALFLMRNLQPDFLAVYYEGIDAVGHRFQHCMSPPLDTCPPEDRDRFRDVVLRFYEYQDRALGQLLDAQVGPYYTLLVSDHGFHNGTNRPEKLLPYTDENPVGWHREEGIFVLKGPGVKPGEMPTAVSVFDVMPTALYLLGMPVAEDFSGQLARAAFTDEFLASHPPTLVRTYEELGPPRRVTNGAVNAEVEQELLANLARLGYISPTTAAEAPAGSAPATDAGESATIGARVNRAKFLISARDWEGALAELNRIPADKLKGRSVSYKAKVLDQLGRKQEAAELLRAALKDHAAEESSLQWLIQLDIELGQPAVAEADFKTYGQPDKQPATCKTSEGLIAEARGRTAQARADFWAALKLDPLQSTAAEHLFTGLAPGERAAFAAVLRQGLAKDPQLGEYHFMLGAMAEQDGRPREALESLRRAVDAEPLVDRYVVTYAGVLARTGSPADAERLLISQSGRSPESPEVWEALGNLRGMRGDFASAAEAFEKAVGAGGSGARLYAGLAVSQAKTGRIEEARRTLSEGLRKNPGDPALLSVKRQIGG